jgi:hypothetical protein
MAVTEATEPVPHAHIFCWWLCSFAMTACHHQSPHSCWLQTIQAGRLTVLEATSLKWVLQGVSGGPRLAFPVVSDSGGGCIPSLVASPSSSLHNMWLLSLALTLTPLLLLFIRVLGDTGPSGQSRMSSPISGSLPWPHLQSHIRLWILWIEVWTSLAVHYSVPWRLGRGGRGDVHRLQVSVL